MNLITTAEAAARLGVSPARVRAMIAAGQIKATDVTTRLKLIDPRQLARVAGRKPGRPKKK